MGVLSASTDALTTPERGARRPWRDLALAGAIVAVVLAVVPPLGSVAEHYVLAQAFQFALIALATPALLVLGAPLERLTPGADGRLRRFVENWATTRQRHHGFRAASPALGAFLVALIAWRLPVAVDALHADRLLLVAEIATFLVAGAAMWGELVASPPLAPHATSGTRVVLATLPMWAVWILAYFMGLTRGTWYSAFAHNHGAISVAADQQLATGCLWATAAAAFLPVIFRNLMRALSDEEDLDDELRRLVRRSRRSRELR